MSYRASTARGTYRVIEDGEVSPLLDRLQEIERYPVSGPCAARLREDVEAARQFRAEIIGGQLSQHFDQEIRDQAVVAGLTGAAMSFDNAQAMDRLLIEFEDDRTCGREIVIMPPPEVLDRLSWFGAGLVLVTGVGAAGLALWYGTKR